MVDPWDDSELARRFLASADTSAARAPLNAALARIVGRDRTLRGVLAHAPPTQQLPVLLLAAIHHLLLAAPGDHELATWYPNLTDEPRPPDDPALPRVLREFVHDHAAALLELVSTRQVQTNEVGRCALLLPAMVLAEAEAGPLAHLDVGASAGLNLLLDRFSYRYDDHPTIGGASTVELACATRGDGPVPDHVPTIASRCGIDRRPIDPLDDDAARWLQACCWPDQADRFDRLRAALALARAEPPEVVAGDAVDQLEGLVERLAGRGHPTITTSWVLNYLPADRRSDFVAACDRLGERLDLSWVYAEAPAMTPELPHPPELRGEQRTAVGLVRWRRGVRTDEHLAVAHPHGYWLHWA